MNTSPVNLDHAATTPVLAEAQAAVADAMALWANPSSPHASGRHARRLLEDARARIAAALDWPHHVILTSGSSEALAIAIGRSVARHRAMSAVEHSAVRRLAPDATVIPAGEDGLIGDLAIEPDTLVAIQHVNSETGVIQPIDRIAGRVRAGGGVLLCDCSQSAGKLALPDADLIAVSAHKLGGPPGIGALLVRDLTLISASGGQEFGYRAGTENLPGALGFAAALEVSRDWFATAAQYRRMLDGGILSAGGEIIARDGPRIATIASYRMPGMSAAAQLIRFDLQGIAVSAGSACASGSLKPGHVLPAIGVDPVAAAETIRVSTGWTTTADDIAAFLGAWVAVARAVARSAA